MNFQDYFDSFEDIHSDNIDHHNAHDDTEEYDPHHPHMKEKIHLQPASHHHDTLSNNDHIKQFYNQKRNESRYERKYKSSITGVRDINNAIKFKLIEKFGPSAPSIKPNQAVNVLDLACGMAGDTQKVKNIFRHLNYWGLDLSDESIRSAQTRCPDMYERFHVANMYEPRTWPEPTRKSKSDLIIQFFAFHYACQTYHTLCQMLDSITDQLKPGGRWIMMTICDKELQYRFQQQQQQHYAQHIDQNSVGNRQYSIHFQQTYDRDRLLALNLDPHPITTHHESYIGIPYYFRLGHNHINCQEFVVPFQLVITECTKRHLKLIASMNCQQSFVQQHFMPKHPNIQRTSSSSTDDWEVVSLQRFYVFEFQPPTTTTTTQTFTSTVSTYPSTPNQVYNHAPSSSSSSFPFDPTPSLDHYTQTNHQHHLSLWQQSLPQQIDLKRQSHSPHNKNSTRMMMSLDNLPTLSITPQHHTYHGEFIYKPPAIHTFANTNQDPTILEKTLFNIFNDDSFFSQGLVQ